MNFTFNLNAKNKNVMNEADKISYNAGIAQLKAESALHLSKLAESVAQAMREANGDTMKLRIIESQEKKFKEQIKEDYLSKVSELKQTFYKVDKQLEEAAMTGAMLGEAIKEKIKETKSYKFISGFWGSIKN